MQIMCKGVWLRLFNFIILCVFAMFASGCTSLGSHVLSHPNIYLPEANLMDVAPDELGFETKTYCADKAPDCVDYLFAKAYQKDDYKPDAKIFYNLHSSGNGIENQISFSTGPADFQRFNGTAVLLHGFGGNKEVMMVTSFYFRSLGMDVVALDLFGHGESKRGFAFGAKEHELYVDLLRQLHQQTPLAAPIIIVGHSMGALPAANILNHSDLADGAILLAPMIRFDQAAKHYLDYKSPLLASLLSDNLPQIVELALKNQDVSISDTDIRQPLQTINKPVLIINSDLDSVSPVEYFSAIQNKSVQLTVFENRSHPSLMAFDKDDTSTLEVWLMTNFDSAAN